VGATVTELDLLPPNVSQHPNRVIVDIGGIERQHLAGKDRDRLRS
jgi:hypothetical protein